MKKKRVVQRRSVAKRKPITQRQTLGGGAKKTRPFSAADYLTTPERVRLYCEEVSGEFAAYSAEIARLRAALELAAERIGMLHKYADNDGRQEIQCWQRDLRAAVYAEAA